MIRVRYGLSLGKRNDGKDIDLLFLIPHSLISPLIPLQHYRFIFGSELNLVAESRSGFLQRVSNIFLKD
jgi:hypothetical protein